MNSSNPATKRRVLKISAILFGAALLFAAGWFSMGSRIDKPSFQGASTEPSGAAARPIQASDYGDLIGRWRQPDGERMIEIRHAGPDGGLDLAYYSPDPVHVARAETVAQGGAIQIFIGLEDEGFPRATLQLLYHPGQNTLTGLFNQPANGGSEHLSFVKKEP